MKRGRPPLDHPRSTRIVVRVTREEATRIAAHCERLGQTVSDRVRDLLLADTGPEPEGRT